MSTRDVAPGRWRRVLDASTNLAIIAVLGYTVYSIREARRVPSPTAREAVTVLATLARGSHPEQVDVVLIVLTPKCDDCSENAGLYGQLARQSDAHRDRFRLTFIVPPGESAPERFLELNGLDRNRILRVRLREYGVTTDPMLLIIDKAGRVRHISVGKLNESQREQVLQYIGT